MAFVDEIDALGATAHWRCEETTGSLAADRVGGDDLDIGSNLTLNQSGGGDDGSAAIQWGTAETSSALSKSALSSSPPVNGVSYDNTTRTDRSCVVIFYLATGSRDTCFMHFGSRDAGIFLYQFATDNLIYCNATNGDGSNYSDSSASGLATGEWHLLGLVQDDTENEIRVYHNDTVSPILTVDITSFTTETLNGTIAFGDFQGVSGTNERARIHDNNVRFTNQGRLVSGLIDEIAYFSGIALAQSDIANLYDVWLNGAASGPAGVSSHDIGFTSSAVGAKAGAGVSAFDIAFSASSFGFKAAAGVSAHDQGFEHSSQGEKVAVGASGVSSHDQGFTSSSVGAKAGAGASSHDAGFDDASAGAKAAAGVSADDQGFEHSSRGAKNAVAASGVSSHDQGFTDSGIGAKAGQGASAHDEGFTGSNAGTKAGAGVSAHDIAFSDTLAGIKAALGISSDDITFTSSTVATFPGDDPVKIALSIETIDKLALSIEMVDKLSLSIALVE